jgi:hypothetical protein
MVFFYDLYIVCLSRLNLQAQTRVTNHSTDFSISTRAYVPKYT